MITARAVLAGLLALIGAVVGGGGVWLAALGGSLYYALGGAAVLACAYLMWRGDARAAWLYASFLIASLTWALWEAGPDAWALTARLMAPAVLGFAFALPGLYRRAEAPSLRERHAPFAAPVAATACLMAIAAAGLAPAPQAGAFPAEAVSAETAGAGGEWAFWGATQGGARYSTLDQINRDTIGALEPAWVYHTGETGAARRSPMQVTPIMVGGLLYLCTRSSVVVALDPDTGEERWRFDPEVEAFAPGLLARCRGVAYHSSPAARECPQRIIAATVDARLMALDAITGRLCASFGEGGFVDLRAGLGDVGTGLYYVSSAPVVVRGRVVVGALVLDNVSIDAPSGVIRAFDAETGALSWAWDMGRPGQRGAPAAGETYTRSTPNSWAPASADEVLGLVYVPIGNPAGDQWGAARSIEAERFGSSIVALDADSGAVRWLFQTTHHDVWDYDAPAQPTLIDIARDGALIPALVAPTKRGELFVLDRRTGAPIARVEERAAPTQGGLASEPLAPTQPYSAGMPSFAGTVSERDMWGFTPFDQLFCRIAFRRLRFEGHLTPPGLDASLVWPGVGGGMNWGGVSADAAHGVAIVNYSRVGSVVQLIAREEADAMAAAGARDLPQPIAGAPYAVQVGTFYSPLNIPCNEPPFGGLAAVDLGTGRLLWKRSVGTLRDALPRGLASALPIPMGMPSLGGTLTTRGGLVFMGAVREKTFRAFDLRTGREVWRARLPSSAHANPMTYASPASGRQYVVIAAGGHPGMGTPADDALIAYALPAR